MDKNDWFYANDQEVFSNQPWDSNFGEYIFGDCFWMLHETYLLSMQHCYISNID